VSLLATKISFLIIICFSLEELGDLRQPKNAAHTITRDQRDVVKTGDVLLQTPLHLAIKKGDRQAAEALLHRGINVDAQDDEERTALHIALINGDLNFIGFLLRKGAGVKIANSRGETALSWALGSGDKVLISMVQAFDNELEDQSGYRRQNTGFVPLNSIATRSTDLFADNERKYNYLKAHDGISSAFTTSDFSTYDHESFIAHMRPARGGHPITTRTCSPFPQHLENISSPQLLPDSPYSCTITANPLSSQQVFL